MVAVPLSRAAYASIGEAAALWSPTYLESEYFNDGIYGYWWYVIVGWRGSWSRNQRSQI